jgi:glycosyltransferase involved in cell wall biosynthesis
MLYLGHHKYYPFTFLNIIKLVKSLDIDVLHLSGYASATFGRIAAYLSGTPVVIQEHWVDPNFGGLMSVVERLLARATTIAVAISEYSRDYLVNKKGIPANKVIIVPNGIPLQNFYDATPEDGLELKSRLGLIKSKKVIGAVGMLHENKGHKLFIDAAAKVLNHRDDVVFIIVGEGETRAELEQYIRQQNLQDDVVLVGQQNNMPAVLQMLDIFVICSYVESFSLSMLEAMSSGNAIITTDCGGPGEIIKSGENGYVVPVGDSDAIANTINKLAGHMELARKLGQQATHDSKQYDIVRVARAIEKIYQMAAR